MTDLNTLAAASFNTDRALRLIGEQTIKLMGPLMSKLRIETARLRSLDAQASFYCETPVVLRTNFSGYPPYTGWRGIGLALEESLDERDLLRKKVRQGLHDDCSDYAESLTSMLQAKFGFDTALTTAMQPMLTEALRVIVGRTDDE